MRRTDMLATTFTGPNIDFFLWGYVKDRVFATPVNDIGELRIHDVITTITGEMLTRTLQEFEYRLDIVRDTNGSHVQVYWCE